MIPVKKVQKENEFNKVIKNIKYKQTKFGVEEYNN